MVFYFLFVLSLFLSYCLDIERRVCWLMLAGNPEYFSLWQFNSVRQFHVRPAVAALSQSGPRSGICRLKTLRFHVEACLVLPGPGRGGEFHNLWVTPGTPSSHPSLRENVDPGKVPWPCLDVWGSGDCTISQSTWWWLNTPQHGNWSIFWATTVGFFIT